jgi:hypothetical protein
VNSKAASIDELLAGLVDAARRNEKDAFDRLERDLLAHFDGGFDGMPRDVYQRYLDVDRHWPITVDPSGAERGRRTLLVRLLAPEEAWIQDLAVSTDRSTSAVLTACIDAVRDDNEIEQQVRARLERERHRETE